VNGERPAACAFCRLRLKLFIEKEGNNYYESKYLVTMMLVCANILTLVCPFAVGFMSLRPSPSLGELEKDNFEAQQAYRDYVEAWKLKDIAALENVISGDYMAVDSRGKVSDKENEIATAKADAEWNSMTVEKIHTRIFGKTAIASGFHLGPRKDKGWKYLYRKSAVPGKTRYSLATRRNAIDFI